MYIFTVLSMQLAAHLNIYSCTTAVRPTARCVGPSTTLTTQRRTQKHRFQRPTARRVGPSTTLTTHIVFCMLLFGRKRRTSKAVPVAFYLCNDCQMCGEKLRRLSKRLACAYRLP